MLFKILIAAVILWFGWRLWKRSKARARPRAFAPLLDDTEARAVLGVRADAGDAEIRAAHRRLIAAVHPDRGGSGELARRINVARDTLLRRRNAED